ncbi:MAG: hypothetical protein V1797_11465 [Pseudomonadota bacterium]
MIEPKHRKLSLVRQSRLLGVSRSALYYQPAGPSAYELELMALMDRGDVHEDQGRAQALIPAVAQQGRGQGQAALLAVVAPEGDLGKSLGFPGGDQVQEQLVETVVFRCKKEDLGIGPASS